MTAVREAVARNLTKLVPEAAATVLKGPAGPTELLMTSVPPSENLLVAHIHGIFAGRIPLRTQHIAGWPEKAPQLQCLHCGGACDAGPPVPVARHYETQHNLYWVFGPFCRPCCAFGYVCETDSTSKQLAPTVELMRRYFGLKKVRVAPPRCAHVRFGGALRDADFYGDSGYTCVATLQPPFVTFANYVVGVHQAGLSGPAAAGSGGVVSASALLPQSAGRLVGLERPAVRATPLAEKKPTGKAPLILEFLASLSSVKDIVDTAEAIDVKPVKRKRAEVVPVEATNYLKQFVKKP